MNKSVLMGRLTRDPEVRYAQGSNMAIARYTLAVDRRVKQTGTESAADFISCVAFGKNAEFAEKYLKKGIKILVVGRIQTGSYTDRNGQRVYTFEVVVDEHEFCESKNANATGVSGSNGSNNYAPSQTNYASNTGNMPSGTPDGFMQIPLDEELPFM